MYNVSSIPLKKNSKTNYVISLFCTFFSWPLLVPMNMLLFNVFSSARTLVSDVSINSINASSSIGFTPSMEENWSEFFPSPHKLSGSFWNYRIIYMSFTKCCGVKITMMDFKVFQGIRSLSSHYTQFKWNLTSHIYILLM